MTLFGTTDLLLILSAAAVLGLWTLTFAGWILAAAVLWRRLGPVGPPALGFGLAGAVGGGIIVTLGALGSLWGFAANLGITLASLIVLGAVIVTPIALVLCMYWTLRALRIASWERR